MHKSIKGLLFDKDGTLFDFHATWGVWCGEVIADLAKGDQSTANRLAGTLGFDLQNSVFLPDSGVIAGTMDEVFDAVQAALPDWDRASVIEYIFETSASITQVPTVPLSQLLSRFETDGYRIGVATNDAEAVAHMHLESAGIAQHFEYISGYDSGRGAKPEPGMLLGFCEATGLLPQQVAMVGDSTHDLRAGRSAGMINIAVLTGLASESDLAPLADVVLPDIGHIPDWLGM